MAMIAPMATAAIIAANNASHSNSMYEIIQSRFINDLKGYIRHNAKFIKNSEVFLKNYSDFSNKSTVISTQQIVDKTKVVMQEQITALIKNVKEHNKTDAKRKKIQYTSWFSKLSTKQKILARLGLKQQKVKNA